ncbi:phosphohistidine phosphatase SixA [Endothiovibrio diazotrophicus]
MRLYLVQHGEALSKEEDPERPLSPRGEVEVERLAGLLERAGVHVTRVIHSGKARARQSAEVLVRAVAPGRDAAAVAGIAPQDDVAAFARQVKEWCEDAMVVGHLPFLGRLAALLVAPGHDGPLLSLRPASVVCLERCDEEGAWSIVWMVRPELLV